MRSYFRSRAALPSVSWLAAASAALFVGPLYAQSTPATAPTDAAAASTPAPSASASSPSSSSSSSASDASQGTLPTVVVTATRQAERADALLADVSVIDRAEIQRNAGDTVADLLARQPGVQMARSGGPFTATSFYIRGANSDEMLVLVDGIPVTSLDPSGSSLSQMSLADVDHIEIVRGPASTLYGANAMSGVIQIFTRQGTGAPGVHVDAYAGYGTHATTQSNIGLSASGDMWRLRLDGFYTGAKSIPSQAGGTNHDALADPYRNDGGSASFALLPAAGHELGVSYRENSGLTHYGSGNVPPDGTFDSRMSYRNSVWQVYSKDTITSFWNSTLRYGQSSGSETSYGDYAPQGSTLAVTNRQLGWQNDLNLPGHWGRVLVAFEHLQQQGSSDDGLQGGTGMSNNSALAGWTGSLGAHSLQVNARYDDNSVYGSKSTWSAAYGYQIAPEWRARASYGTAFKAPTLYQLYAPYYGNAALQPETSTNRELGLTWEHAGQSVSATWYLNHINHMIDWSPVTYVYENVNRAKLQGVTLAYEGRFGDWSARAAYDWLQATDESTGLLLGRRARNKATLGLNRRWAQWNLGAELQAVGARYDTNADTTRLGGYTLVNLTARYAIGQTVSVEGRIDNLFNKQYQLAQGYNTPGVTVFVGVRYTPR